MRPRRDPCHLVAVLLRPSILQRNEVGDWKDLFPLSCRGAGGNYPGRESEAEVKVCGKKIRAQVQANKGLDTWGALEGLRPESPLL